MDKQTESINDTFIYQNAVKAFGSNHQIMQAIQEMAELIQALTKNDIDNTIEEIVDTQIMLDQLKIIHKVHDENKYQEIRNFKMTRLTNLINNRNQSNG